MAENEKCSASVRGIGICKNGFPQNSACLGGNSCNMCDSISKTIAPCLKEDWTELGFAVWFNEDGSPKHYKGDGIYSSYKGKSE